MMQSKDDPRLRFIVTILVILGVIILGLVAMLVYFARTSEIAPVILAVGASLSLVMAVALGYNVFAKYKDTAGRKGELQASAPKDKVNQDNTPNDTGQPSQQQVHSEKSASEDLSPSDLPTDTAIPKSLERTRIPKSRRIT